MSIKLFPVLDEKNLMVPYELVMRHNAQAFANHMQNVDRLAERGGLSIEELYYVLSDKPYDFRTGLNRMAMIDWIVDTIEECNKGLLERIKEADKLGLRPCVVKVQVKPREYETKTAYFHKWCDRSKLIDPSPLLGGTPGGIIKYVTGLIEYEDGTMDEVLPKSIQFTDRG